MRISKCYCGNRYIETSKHKQCVECKLKENQFNNQTMLLHYQYDQERIALKLKHLIDNGGI